MNINIDWKIIIIFLFFYLNGELDVYLIFIISIILHEIGHIVVSLIFRCKPKNIYIGIFGLCVNFYSYNKCGIYKKIITYLAGPFMNIFIIIVTILINKNCIYYEKIFYTNILLAMFNLLPIIPLDGGMVIKEIMKKIVGIKKASIYILNISKIFLIILSLAYSILILKFRNIIILCAIIYLWYLYYIEYKRTNILIKSYNAMENFPII